MCESVEYVSEYNIIMWWSSYYYSCGAHICTCQY
jgi:hypothetical protein